MATVAALIALFAAILWWSWRSNPENRLEQMCREKGFEFESLDLASGKELVDMGTYLYVDVPTYEQRFWYLDREKKRRRGTAYSVGSFITTVSWDN